MNLRVLALLAGLLMSLATSVQAQTYPARYVDSIQITSNVPPPHGTITIAANAWLPDVADRSQRFPLIVMPNSWGMDEYEYRYPAKAFAQQGYVVVSYSARGWGKTDGLVDVAGPADVQDGKNVIDWALANLPVDPDRIGMAGISYGGGLSLLITAADSRVKTVAAMSAWASLLDALDEDGTPAVLWTRILEMVASLDHATIDDTAKAYLQDVIDYEITDDMRDWALRRSPFKSLSAFNQRAVPVFVSNNLQDYLFQPSNMWDFYRQLTGPRRMLLNQGQHAAAENSGLLGQPSHIWDEVHAWMDRYLEGSSTADLSLPGGMTMLQPFGTTTYFAVDPSDPLQIENRTLYLSGGADRFTGGLAETQAGPPPDFTLTPGDTGVSVVPTAIPLVQAVEYVTAPFTVPWVPLTKIDRTHAAVYVSDPVPPNGLWQLRGMPTLQVPIRLQGVASKPGVSAQLIAYLYDIGQDGVGNLVTFGPATLVGPQPSSIQTLSIRMRMTGWDLAPGHRLALIVGTDEPLFTSRATAWQATAATLSGAGRLVLPMQGP